MKLKESTQQNGSKLSFDEWIKVVTKGKPYKIYKMKNYKNKKKHIAT